MGHTASVTTSSWLQLSRGAGWCSLHTARGPKGSRLENVAARPSQCGITTVQQGRRMANAGKHVAPQTHGARRARGHGCEEHDVDTQSTAEDASARLWDAGADRLAEASLQAAPVLRDLGGARGRFLPQAAVRLEQIAMDVTIGRSWPEAR